jgi:glycosyltransferase involved in cell wall biosynthesis
MKIAITGTRGIPNRYGGFEQFAEKISAELAERGHEIWVYNPVNHPCRSRKMDKVRLIRKTLPEGLLGPGAHYLYDFICLRDAVRKAADVILECGYASAAPSYPLLRRRKSLLVTHMDGMEWQRGKWSPWVQRIMRNTVNKAIRYSDALVCDHPHIMNYYKENYACEPVNIGYGAEIPEQPDSSAILHYKLEPGNYFLCVARLEPENNIRMIIEGHRASGTALPLVMIGDTRRGYGKEICSSYSADDNVLFPGTLFDTEILNNLRHFSKGIFHGHSVGGTNPSLLESMACGAWIIAHDNPYNRHVLGGEARYFSSRKDIKDIIMNEPGSAEHEAWKARNLEKIRRDYQWPDVAGQYEKLFQRLLAEKK